MNMDIDPFRGNVIIDFILYGVIASVALHMNRWL